MALQRQAKTLSKAQIDAVLSYLAPRRHALRNRVIFLLSVRAGLRAKEIANLTWAMLTDSSDKIGTAIRLQNKASKGKNGGRHIPLNKSLRSALVELHAAPKRGRPSPYVITSERGPRQSAQSIVNLFSVWYADLGFHGCSSHSGRRTFITGIARKIGSVGGSLRDVQALAGHAQLSTTQKYVDQDTAAQKKVVDLIC